MPQTHTKAGLTPGSLRFFGVKKEAVPKVMLTTYHETHFEQKEISLEGLNEIPIVEGCVNWVNIDGIHDENLIAKIGKQFQLHSLLLEDILHTRQRPKIDVYQNASLIIARMLYDDAVEEELVSEQIAMVLTKDNVLLTFQEKEGDVFQHVRARLEQNAGIIRKKQADYLCYSLLDAIVDEYFVILDQFELEIEELEDTVIQSPNEQILQQILHIKRDILYLRKTISPLQALAGTIIRQEADTFSVGTDFYFRDLLDHILRINDTIDLYRDTVTGLQDLCLSTLSNQMNNVMKVLTVIATIFIPLTFVSGVYGMNFDYMPELHWPYSYFVVWGVMISMVLGMLYYFRRKGWL